MRLVSRLGFSLLIILSISAVAFADIRIKQKQTVAGRTTESEVAIKGARQRSEMELGPGMKTVSILQCDLKRSLTLSEMAKKYTVTPLDSGDTDTATPTPTAGTPSTPSTVRRGGVVTYTTSIVDTGERKKMFGFTARHIKSSMITESSPDACQQEKQHIETDGWYIDLGLGLECITDRPVAPAPPTGRPGGCQDRVRFKRTGTGKLGYPVLVTTRFLDANGDENFSMTTEVVELSQATLEPSLFDVPAGYTEAASVQELYAPPSMATGPATGGVSVPGQAGASAAIESAAAAAAGAAPAKAPGTIRVGVVGIKNITGEPLNTEGLRSGFIESIAGGNVEAVPIYAASVSDVSAEAKQKGCDFVVYSEVTGLKQSAANKLGGMLGRAAGIGSDVVKSRYETQVDFRMLPTGSETPQLQSKANVKQDGDADDVVRAALDKAGKAVNSAAKKK